MQDFKTQDTRQVFKLPRFNRSNIKTSRPRFNLLYLSPSSVRNSSHRTLKTRLALGLRDTPQAFKCFELQDASRFKRKTQDFKIQDSRTPQDASSSKAPQASVQASRRVKTSRSVKTRSKTFKTHNFNLRRASTLKASRYSETSMGCLKTQVASRHLKTPQVQGASSFKTLRLQASGSRYLKTQDFNLLQDVSRLEASRYFKTSVGNCSRHLKFKTSVGHCTRFSRRLKTQDLKTAQDSRFQDALKNSSRFKSFDSDCFYDLY
ncbi:hypothetical protein K438DRAFT_1747859 [Mycena galopus ATCC 62051]|nr:hypothetical protein K438DRAFT_1747859 [Mycena galopus ATCC 62051]